MKFSLFINAIGILFLILLASPTNYASVILFPELKEEDYFVALDNLPVPIGGYESIMKKIIYPEMAIKTKTEGKVYVMIYIDESGTVNDARVVRGIGSGCDEEAVKVVKKTRFIPATSKGAVVKAKFAVALSFKAPV